MSTGISPTDVLPNPENILLIEFPTLPKVLTALLYNDVIDDPLLNPPFNPTDNKANADVVTSVPVVSYTCPVLAVVVGVAAAGGTIVPLATN